MFKVNARPAMAGLGKALAAAATIGLAGCALWFAAPQAEASTEPPVITEDGKIGSSIGYPSDGPIIDNIDALTEVYSHAEEEAANAEAYPPKTYVDRNGFTIQAVPADSKGYNTYWLQGDERGCLSCHDTLEDAMMNQNTYQDRNGFTIQAVPADSKGYNTYWLQGDERGCLSCHDTLEDAMMNQNTYHRLIIMGYPVEQGVQNCVMCHDTWQPQATKLKDTIHQIRLIIMGYPVEQGVQNCVMCHDTWQPQATKLKDTIHQIHMSNSTFNAMNGNCMSCHAIDDNGDFVLWDDVKYDQYKGYKLVSAEDSGMTVSYDQDTITPLENQFYKTIKSEPSLWTNDDTQIDPTIYESWTIEIGGEVENPFTMTLPELKEMFGTKTAVIKMDCNVNGIGQGSIYQAEVTGIPLKDVIEYAKPLEGTNGYWPKGYDGFGNLMPIEYLDEDALLVLEVNGETLRPSQGYPVAVWVGGGAAACECPKYVTTINVVTEDDEATLWTHPREGTNVKPGVAVPEKHIYFPNAGVLNCPTGVVFEDQVGKEINFEGYADAFDEPIAKVEFSLDGGKTWLTMETPETDVQRWVYWRMNFTPLEGYADAFDEPIAKVEFSLDGGKTWLTMETPETDVQRWVYWRMNFTPQEAGSYHLKIRAYSLLEDGSLHEPYYTTDFMFTVH